MRITNVPITPDATGSYRCLWPMRHLGLHGHQVMMPRVQEHTREDGRIEWRFEANRAAFDKVKADIWMIQARWEKDWAESLLAQIRTAGSAIVIECDDNYVETPEYNPAFYGIHPYRSGNRIINRAERRSKGRRRQTVALLEKNGVPARELGVNFYTNYKNTRNRTWAFEAMKMAECVITSTPYLAEVYSQFNKNVKVIRNYLEWELWEGITPQYEVERERTRIGYLGVFAWRRGDLDVISPWIGKFMRRHPDCEFVANSDEVHDYLNIPCDQRVTVGEYAFYQGQGKDPIYPVAENTACLDIGLVPLAMNGLNEGKSHLKGLEYNAAGVPYLASPTESYKWFTQEMENGVTCHTTKDWEHYLEVLVNKDDMRRKMGAFGRRKARDNSLDYRWKEWEDALVDILGPREQQVSRHCLKYGAVQKISELTSLLTEVQKLEPKTVVEVGSARGGTFWGLAQVAHPEALLVSVDIPSGSPLDVREGKDVYSGRDRERMRSYVLEGQRCRLIDGNSQLQETVDKLVDTLGTNPIDVLFIDADHRYEGVKRDWELYSPLVRSGGLIAFHDVIVQNDRRSGVHILWNQLKKEYPLNYMEWVGDDNWGLGTWGGIGVIIKP